MKFNKKMMLISAALLTVAPAISTVSQVNIPTVQAAAKQRNTITVPGGTPLTNSRGKMLTTYKGKRFITFNKPTTLKYYGAPRKIGKTYYYYIGNGAYVDASFLSKINGREVLGLNLNSYVYTRSGKRTKRLLRKQFCYRFTGKYVQNDIANNYVFTKGNHNYQLKTVKIKGNDYFQIGRNQYIRALNVASIGGYNIGLSQMQVTIKRNTPILMVGADGSTLHTDKTAKKGQKYTVDARVGMNVGANSMPSAYRIKGTKTYIWTKDAYSRHMLSLQLSDVSETTNYVVRPPKDNLQFYNMNGENITPSGYTYPRHQLLGVDGQMYIWVPKENKAELFYHIVATNKSFDTIHAPNTSYRDDDVEIGNAFVKASEVEEYSGLTKPAVINTAEEAKTDAETQATTSELNKLQTLVDNANTVKQSAAYKLTGHSTQKNYDVSVKEAQTMLNSKRKLSAAEVKLTSWILQTRVKNLYGKKITVKNPKKLSSTEINQLRDLLNLISYTDLKNKTYTRFSYDRVGKKVYKTVSTLSGTKLSDTALPLTDFVTER
ncbi:SLAP domain-containing protein [Lactobacillus ultunensis]|uniref:S-layer protein C-terminal domain-containing protein n=1 Tax=Lactobacillus ultunensis DSM 16047 TaxID=525365 RepID=C2EN66_9LACO|nr:SLAP domain-containing protein [Lactobacillus ultunensis]EEJ72020.1 hypothetical protein HMPREF0548_1112 [Lactobacillus ultunensis DSM 16047]KRL80472.1 serine protease [Lactobacillus ultunensis DSM 16047]QQP27713.1 SLAP domain-containing protein [Lactobacillus ultunensis]